MRVTVEGELPPGLDDFIEALARIEGKLDVALADIEDKLDRSINLMNQVRTQENKIMADLTALATEVAENDSAIDSAVTLLGSLSQQIRDLSTDPAALQALADQLDAQTNELAEAVVANTPVEPEPPTP